MRRENKVHIVYVPPNGGWGWAVIFAVFICNCITDGVTLTYGIFVEPFLTNLIGNYFMVMLICAVNIGVDYLLRPFVCGLANKFSERTIGILGGIIAASGYGLSIFESRSDVLILTNGIIAGIGLSMIYVPTKLVLGLYFESYRNTANIISFSAFGFGMICLAPVLEYYTINYGWRYAYFIITCLMLVTAFMALFYLPLTPIIVTENEPIKSSLKNNESTYNSLYYYFTHLNYPTSMNSISQTRMQLANNPSQEKKSTFRTQYENIINCMTCNKCSRTYSMRPLYRDDIFFLNNLNLLPMYKTSVDHIPINQLQSEEDRRNDRKRKVKFHKSVTRIREEEIDLDEDRTFFGPFINALTTLLSSSLLKSTSYHLYLFASGISFYGFMAPLVYIRHRASFYGIDDEVAIWLYAAIGLGRTVANILIGILPSYTRIKIEIVYVCISALIFILGGLTALSGYSKFEQMCFQLTYCFIFGFCFSTLTSIRPLILVKLFGLDHLTSAFGLQMIISGIAASLGISINGFILHRSDNFNLVFIMSGVTIGISGLLFGLVVFVRKYEYDRNENNQNSYYDFPSTSTSRKY